MDQTADPPYTNTPEGRARLARIRHPLEDVHAQGCALLLHHKFDDWSARRDPGLGRPWVEPPACDCGGRDHQAELEEAVEALAYALRHPPQDMTNDLALQMASDIIVKLQQALR